MRPGTGYGKRKVVRGSSMIQEDRRNRVLGSGFKLAGVRSSLVSASSFVLIPRVSGWVRGPMASGCRTCRRGPGLYMYQPSGMSTGLARRVEQTTSIETVTIGMGQVASVCG